MVVHQLRGASLETVHPVRAVAVRDGAVVLESGAPRSSPWRSAAKPVQLACSLEAIGDPDLPEDEVAIGASSHSGQDFHLELVRRVLARFGVGEEDLACGATPPVHAPTWRAMLARGEPARPIHSDCSGKHAFMLAACRARGWSHDYLDPEHPLQRRIAAAVVEWTAGPVGPCGDGCGVPTFSVPIEGMARAWARLADAMAAGEGRDARIGWAMARNPRITSGDDRLDLAVARAAREPMAVKIGAQGIFCIAIPGRRLGIALKVASGDEDALAVAVAAMLERTAPGAWVRPDEWPWSVVRNDSGVPVGERVAVVG